jgi:GntR family transcriptional repressor for pyruvate dehydrogenase complex
MLSVGRSTVREALRIMEAMGFIEIRPGRGAFVLRNAEDDLSPLAAWFAEHATEVRDYVEVRMAIEPLAMRLMVDRATPEEIAGIEAVHRDRRRFVIRLVLPFPTRSQMIFGGWPNTIAL